MIEFFLCTIIVLLVVLVAVLAKSLNETKKLASNRLLLIKDWLDLLYVFSDDSQAFHNRCKNIAHQAIDEIQYCQLEPSQRNNQDEMA